MADKFEFEKLKITDSEWEPIKISNVATRPNAKTAYGTGLSAEDTKKLFDRPTDLLRKRFNSLTEYAAAEEAARAEAEKARDNAETTRDDNEDTRIKDEKERVTAEEKRQINEFGAVGNYYEEEANAVHNSLGEVIPNAEGGRVGAEIQRRLDEAERISNENDRKQKEAERKSNETERKDNESERVSNENRRIEKDGYREAQVEYIVNLVGDTDAALDAILAIQNGLIGGAR